MIFSRILGTENTPGGASTWPRGSRARPHPLGAPPASWAPRGPPPLIPAPTHFVFLQINHHTAQTRVLARFAAIFDLLKAPLTKLLWGIVLRYVTPPMVQLVFVLVLYLLQIFAA